MHSSWVLPDQHHNLPVFSAGPDLQAQNLGKGHDKRIMMAQLRHQILHVFGTGWAYCFHNRTVIANLHVSFESTRHGQLSFAAFNFRNYFKPMKSCGI